MAQSSRYLTYRGALSSIESGRLARLYVLWGDAYLVGRVVDALRRKTVAGTEALDLARIDAATVSPSEVAAAVRTASFFGGRRLILIERPRFLRPRAGRGAAGSASSSETASPADQAGDDGPADGAADQATATAAEAPGGDWDRALANIPASSVVVLLADGPPDSRLRLTKALAAYGGFVECQATGRDAHALAGEIVRQIAGELGLRMDWRAQGLLITTVGSDCGRLVQELHKLRLYSETGQVTERDIMLLCPRTAEADIWQLLDAVEKGDSGEAVRIVRAALSRGESPVALIASLASQIRIMARARERTLVGISPRALPEVLGANRFWVEQSLRRAQYFSLEALYRSIRELARLDVAIKTGALDGGPAVETYVLGLAAARTRDRAASPPPAAQQKGAGPRPAPR